MIDFVLGGLELFGGLLVDLALVLLLFVELVDELVLVSDFIV